MGENYNFDEDLSDSDGEGLEVPVIESTFDLVSAIIQEEIIKIKSSDEEI